MKKRVSLLLLATFLVYAPVLRAGFIWDDHAHVPERPSVYSVSGLRQIWTTPGYVQQYYPLSFTTVWLAHHLWDRVPLGYHALTLALHMVNAVLVALVLLELNVPFAWGAAVLFALHPLQVETVAWISELKNTQSTFFMLLAFLSYWRFRSGRRAFYGVSFLLFLAALFSKTTACSLPVLILAGVLYRNGRLTWKDFVPLVPFFAAGLGFGLTTASWEKNLAGAMGPDWDYSFVERCRIAGRAWWFYLEKLVWPHTLMFMYPKWMIHGAPASSLGYAAGALLVLLALWFGRRRLGKGPFIALASYTVIIGPALGFISVYPMRYSFVADHFQYVACIPVFALVAAGFHRWKKGGEVLALVCLAMAWVSATRLPIFQNPETLWRDTVMKNPTCVMARLNLAHELLDQGLFVEAQTHLQEAARLDPDNFNVQLNQADFALRAQHNPQDAVGHFARAYAIIQKMPAGHVKEGNTLLVHYYLGQSLLAAGRKEEAKKEFEETERALAPLMDRPYFDTSPEFLATVQDTIDQRLATH